MTITVRLVGGLGNQLFQYAAGRALAKQHRTDLWLDTSFLDKGNSHRPRAGSKSHITRRAYELHHWSCPAALVADLKPRRQDKIVEQPSFSFYKNFFSLGDDTYLIGYWQGYRYLAGMEQTVKAMFEPLKNPSAETQRLLKVIRDSNAAVMVHIRRGDYVHLSQAAKFHGTLTLDYYDQAMAWIEKKITKPHFFIFSDDAVWVKKNMNLAGKKITYVTHNREGDDAWQDMLLMGHCRHAIIANSSFSWWGAYLIYLRHGVTGSVVVAPRRWFRAMAIKVDDLFLPHWHLLVGQQLSSWRKLLYFYKNIVRTMKMWARHLLETRI